MKKFWMVWNPSGRAPTFKHETEVQAEGEAKRLASLHRGQSFFILEAKKKAVAVDVEVIELCDGSRDSLESQLYRRTYEVPMAETC